MTMRLLIVGGSDAGISAALRDHELDPNAEITVLLADDFPNYSSCGLPFYLSGETPDWSQTTPYSSDRRYSDGAFVRCSGPGIVRRGDIKTGRHLRGGSLPQYGDRGTG